MPFGLQGLSSVLMRVMNAVMTKGLRRRERLPGPGTLLLGRAASLALLGPCIAQ